MDVVYQNILQKLFTYLYNYGIIKSDKNLQGF
jgi:hypothetical protein